MKSPIAYRVLLLLLLPLLTACGRDEIIQSDALGSGNLKWTSFPVPVKADQSLMNSDSDQAAITADIRAAMAFWEAKSGRSYKLFSFNPADINTEEYYKNQLNDNPLLLGNVIAFIPGSWPFNDSTDVVGKTLVQSNANAIDSAVVLINGSAGKTFCGGDLCEQGHDNYLSRRNLIAHELGHFLGLGHSSDIKDIMNPVIQGDIPLDEHTVNDVILQKVTAQ